MPGLLILLCFLALGTLLQSLFALPVPASIIGMLLLLVGLVLMRRVPEPLNRITLAMSPWLPLFLTPVSVGIITHEALILEHGPAILAILAVSLIPGIIVCALVMNVGRNA